MNIEGLGRSGRGAAALFVGIALLAAACGSEPVAVEPAPGQPTESSSTTAPETDISDSETLETEDGSQTTVQNTAPITGSDEPIDVSDLPASVGSLVSAGFEFDSQEQACMVNELPEAGEDLDTVVGALRACTAPKTTDDFAAGVFTHADIAPDPTEAACLASMMFDPGEHETLIATSFDGDVDIEFGDLETDAQNSFLDLYLECASIGRFIEEQIGEDLTSANIGCIDGAVSTPSNLRDKFEADERPDTNFRLRTDRLVTGCISAELGAIYAQR